MQNILITLYISNHNEQYLESYKTHKQLTNFISIF